MITTPKEDTTAGVEAEKEAEVHQEHQEHQERHQAPGKEKTINITRKY